MHKLPASVERICMHVSAPPLLIGHLTLVHDVARQLVVQLTEALPDLQLDTALTCYGAAVHDIGKVRVPEELYGPGKRHEHFGYDLLRGLSLSHEEARFCLTHGNWDSDESLPIEDLLVALADDVWCGRRDSKLELRIAMQLPGEDWASSILLDEIIEPVAARGEERLAWQRSLA